MTIRPKTEQGHAESERELLELAAKAAGIELAEWSNEAQWYFTKDWHWNPLTDDGDALRLAVKLDIKITPYPIYQFPKHSVLTDRLQLRTGEGSFGPQVIELHGNDPYAATRRAIVRAAAEIGRELGVSANQGEAK